GGEGGGRRPGERDRPAIAEALAHDRVVVADAPPPQTADRRSGRAAADERFLGALARPDGGSLGPRGAPAPAGDGDRDLRERLRARDLRQRPTIRLHPRFDRFACHRPPFVAAPALTGAPAPASASA